MTNKYVLDANIPLAFNKIQDTEFLVKFFNESNGDASLIMSEANYDECSSVCNKMIKSILSFNEIDKQKTMIIMEHIKKVCHSRFTHQLHGGDKDYHAMACCLVETADVLVTNDEGMIKHFDYYLTKEKIKPRPTIMRLPDFLRMIIETRRGMIPDKSYAKVNLDIYGLAEISRYFNSIQGVQLDSSNYQSHATELNGVFTKYSNNVVSLFR